MFTRSIKASSHVSDRVTRSFILAEQSMPGYSWKRIECFATRSINRVSVASIRSCSLSVDSKVKQR